MANQTVAAVFDRYEDAADAVSKLEAAGVAHSDISIVSNDATHRSRFDENAGTGLGTARAEPAATGAGTGATVGTAVGAGAGILAGIGMLAIPGLGPVVAAGWLVSALVGAGAGAAAGGLLGSLTGAGISETDAHTYAEAVNRGGTLVTVRATDANHSQVVSILDTKGTIDLGQRESSWRSEGWTGQYKGNDTAEDTLGGTSVGADPMLGRPGALGADQIPRGGVPSGTDSGLAGGGVDPYPAGVPTSPTSTTTSSQPRVRSYRQ